MLNVNYINLFTKVCKSCGDEKDIKDFYKRNKNSELQRHSSCKKCLGDKQKTYKTKKKVYPKEYYTNSEMKRKYNITKEEYNRMFKDQNGKCAICRIPQEELSKRLSIDHCHKTGKIRGLLCQSCNIGLGNFKDNIINLEDAIYYLILNKT